MTEEEKKWRELTLGEKAVNWAKAMGIILPLVGAGVLSVLGWFKGDDAQGDVTSLVKQLDKRVAKQEKIINVQSEQLEKMARRLIFFQGHQEGRTAGKMQAKIDLLEHELATLKAKKITSSVASQKLVKIIKSAQKKEDDLPKPAPPAPPPQADQVQSIPRIKSAPFHRKGK